jgi:cytochrome P450
MRAEAPVLRNQSRTEGTTEFWSITRASDIETISKQPAKFSSAEAGIWMRPDAVAPLELVQNLVIFKDPPEHTRYRKLLQLAFTPRTVAHLEDVVRARVTRILDQACASGSMDVTRDPAIPIPLGVIADLLGASQEDVGLLQEWTSKLDVGVIDPESGLGVEALMDMGEYLETLIPTQLNTDSLIGLLGRADMDGDRLTEEELLLFFGILVFAGNDTTRSSTSCGALALIEHPDELRALAADPSLIPNAVEEILRWSTPLNFFARTVLRDTEIRGVPIGAGERVVMWYASGSRDDEALAGADRFDVTRPVEFHPAFGGGGRHFCLGAGLARLELKVIFEEFARRVREPRLSGPAVRHATCWVNGWDSIPIEFTPA